MSKRDLPALLRDAERRVNAFLFHRVSPSFATIPANRDRDVDLLLCEAAEVIEKMTETFERIVRMPMKHSYKDGCMCMGCVPKAAALEALGHQTGDKP